jgi:hypothetical protein
LLAPLSWPQHPPMPRGFLQPSADPLALCPFRFRDTLTGK